MPTFPMGSNRIDPYKNFKFKVFWEGKTEAIAAVGKVSGFKRTTTAIDDRSGDEQSTIHKTLGRTTYDPITLERAVTLDEEFERWATKVWNSGAGPGTEVSLKGEDFRKNIMIEILNEAGQKVIAYKVYRCWVSEYTPFSELDAMGNAVLTQTIKLENEGWERDTSVSWQDEPQFDEAGG